MRVSRILLLSSMVLLGAFMGAGCRRHPASADDCKAVLDRIIELELHESGYRDPALRMRWQKDLARQFAPELERCHGLSVQADLGRCLGDARAAEDIVHRCLK